MRELFALLRNQRAKTFEQLESIPDESLNWRVSDVTWSPAQVFEHCALMDQSVAVIIQHALAHPMPYVEEKRPLHRLTDRRIKVEAPEPVQPRQDSLSSDEVRSILEQHRTVLESVLASVDSDDALRHLTSSFLHPVFGQLSLLQWGQFVAGHEERHMLQIEEILEGSQIRKETTT